MLGNLGEVPETRENWEIRCKKERRDKSLGTGKELDKGKTVPEKLGEAPEKSWIRENRCRKNLAKHRKRAR